MTAPAVVFRGKAAIEGVAGTFDAILYALQQTVKVTQNFEEEVVKDVHGYDAVWLFRNEHSTFDCTLKLVGDTAAHSIIPATAAGGGTVSSLGQPFLAPGSTVILASFSPAGINGTYQLLSGGDVDLANTKIGDLTLKLRKYANADQTTAIAAVPS